MRLFGRNEPREILVTLKNGNSFNAHVTKAKADEIIRWPNERRDQFMVFTDKNGKEWKIAIMAIFNITVL